MDRCAIGVFTMEAAVKQVAREEQSFSRLQRMGVYAWEQVLLMLPISYHDYSSVNTTFPQEARYPVARACYRVTVVSPPNRKRMRPPMVVLRVTDGCTTANLAVFGDIWIWEQVQKGQEIVVEAVLDVWNGYFELKNATLVPPFAVGKVLPQYQGKRGASKAQTISSEFVYSKTREALDTHLDATAAFILSHFTSADEPYLIRRSGLAFNSLREMLLAIHRPCSFDHGRQGLAAARQLAAFEVVFNAERQMARKPNPKSVIAIRQKDVDNLIGRFPHQMTDDQLAAIADIVTDLRSPYRMMRLLSGDVGYGKTDVSIIPALAAHLAGAKVVVMAPSLLIVQQWVDKISGYGKFPVQVVAGKVKIDQDLLTRNPIMVGTTALVTRLPKLGWTADLICFDEQQKHGRNHKESLISENTNRLEATATCQPKTGALVHYGGMDASILNQCPVEKHIHTRIVTSQERARVFDHLQRVLDGIADAQIAIVYPNVLSEKGPAKSSLLSVADMWEKRFPGKVGILHGDMSDDEKLAIIASMYAGDIRALLSSTLIETGVTLPSLRGMLVVGADRFGISTLHQLRGRLARHGGVGYFHMLLQSEVPDETLQRLELLVQHTDGFILAERDAELRGYGSMHEDDASQSGRSRSAMFFGMSLMPKDIETALGRATA